MSMLEDLHAQIVGEEWVCLRTCPLRSLQDTLNMKSELEHEVGARYRKLIFELWNHSTSYWQGLERKELQRWREVAVIDLRVLWFLRCFLRRFCSRPKPGFMILDNWFEDKRIKVRAGEPAVITWTSTEIPGDFRWQDRALFERSESLRKE